MKVLKFGGSSVATPDRIRGIIDILTTYHQRGDSFTVVFSAFGGVTDQLIAMSTLAEKGDEEYLPLFEAIRERHLSAAADLLSGPIAEEVKTELQKVHDVLKNLLYGIYLIREASTRTMDYVLSFGERISAYLIAKTMQMRGLPAEFLDARQIIKTDKSFGSAKVDFHLTYDKIKEYYQEHNAIQVVTGFIGSAKGGLTTTLGRGGSDYTAAIIAAGLEAEVIEIWTDVDGVLTADPRRVKKAFTIPTMTYAEAMEMSHFGAKVIYPPTLQPALAKKIPLYIKNTFNPNFVGTYISTQPDLQGRAVKGISSINHVALLTLQGSGLFGVPGIAARLFGALANKEINVILITQGSSEHAISFAIQPQNAKKAKQVVEEAFEYEMRMGLVEPVKMEDELSVVAIIGENMRYRPGIAGRMFQALGKNGVNAVAIAQGSSELNISVVINRPDESKALNALHEAFFLSDTKELHLFIIGVGLIGSTLLNQIRKHAAYLRRTRSLEIKVVGLANSKKMVFDDNGIDLSQWRTQLQQSNEIVNLSAFVEKMKTYNLSNTIFVDNTADGEVAKLYEGILDESISISTPNKIATSSSYAAYKHLKELATKRGVQFRYETNVGAGLPVISTLNDLIDSGDEILQIEGVLSGSLSFIFNSFMNGVSFSEIVLKARELGYTEPDPRIDLKGVDVQRKVVILARESGLAIEPEDVTIIPFLPEYCYQAKSVEDFLLVLSEADDFMEDKRFQAEKEGKVLRMVARIKDGKAIIGLDAVAITHPFYFLSGSDNMIVFTTERYKDRPLVVRGPGAGAEVTAAGVFAEIISIGSFLQ